MRDPISGPSVAEGLKKPVSVKREVIEENALRRHNACVFEVVAQV